MAKESGKGSTAKWADKFPTFQLGKFDLLFILYVYKVIRKYLVIDCLLFTCFVLFVIF